MATEDDVRLIREVAHSDEPLDEHLCGLLDLPRGSTIGKAAWVLLNDASRFRERPEIQVRPDERPEV